MFLRKNMERKQELQYSSDTTGINCLSAPN